MKQANYFLISRGRCFLLRSYPYAKLHCSSVNTLRNSVCLRTMPVANRIWSLSFVYPATQFSYHLSLAQVYPWPKSLTQFQIFCLSCTCVDIRQSQGCYHSFYPVTYFPLYLSLVQVYPGLKSLTQFQIFCLSRTCVDIRQSQGCHRKFKSLSKEASSY